jgi:Tol biopolymer transport system component
MSRTRRSRLLTATRKTLSIAISIAMLSTFVGPVSAFAEPVPPTVITAAYGTFSPASIGSYQLNGNAALNAGGFVRLTESAGGQTGSMFWRQKVALQDSGSFSTQFAFQLSDPAGMGWGDGFTFCIQPGTNTAYGVGGGLGYEGIPNSFAVEFDTWQNTEYGDPDGSHVGVDLNGNVTSVATALVPALTSGLANYAWVDYDGATQNLQVRVSDTNVRPATALIEYTIDLLAAYGPDVFLGFTAATGGALENHDILGWYFSNKYEAGGLDPATILYTMGPSSITSVADPTALDGGDTSNVTFTVKDIDGAVMAGQHLAVSAPLGGVVSTDGVTTDGSGQGTVVFTAPAGRQIRTVRAASSAGLFGEASIVVDDAVPVVNVQAGITEVDAYSTTIVAPAATVTDADDASLTAARIRIVAPESGSEGLSTVYGGSLSYSTLGTEVTFSGSATLGEYETALRSVTYGGDPTVTTRQIEFSVFDGLAWSTPVLKTIEVIPPPPLTTRVTDTIRMSTDAEGNQGMDNNEDERGSRDIVVSADGDWSIFLTGNSLVTSDTNTEEGGGWDWYVKNRVTGAVEPVSIATDGTFSGYPPNGNYTPNRADISADGRYVTFDTYSDNLVVEDYNEVIDVFYRDRVSGVTSRVSVDDEGTEYRRGSRSPVISDDGRYVAFVSGAPLVAGDTNGDPDIYVRDMTDGGTIERVSVGPEGSDPDSSSDRPAISADGRYVAYVSNASNLVPDDTNGYDDIFVYDRESKETTRVSVGFDGQEADEESDHPSISADGRYVAFESDAGNLVEGDDNGNADIFVFDRQSGKTVLASPNVDGEASSGSSWEPAIDASGTAVAFESGASDLVPGDVNGYDDIFVRSLTYGTTSIVTVAEDGGGADDHSQSPSINGNGLVVGYESDASNLVGDDTNGRTDVFVALLGPALPPNTAPVAVNDSNTAAEYQLLERAAPGVLANDTDPDGDKLSAELVKDVGHGTLKLNADGSYGYTSAKGWFGKDTFTYRAFDGELYSEPATVTITVLRAVEEPRMGGSDRYVAGVKHVVIASGADRAAADPLTASGLTGVYDAPLLLIAGAPRALPADTAQALREIYAAAGRGLTIHIVGGIGSVSESQVALLKRIAPRATFDRIGGADRYEVAANIARRMKSVTGLTPASILIANGENRKGFGEPLAAAPIAGKMHYPVLLTKRAIAPQATIQAIRDLAIKSQNRWAVGPTDSVSMNMMMALGVPVSHRIYDAGDSSRYGTAAAVARFALGHGWLSATKVGIANATPDSVTAGAVMGKLGGPVLFVGTDIPVPTRVWLMGNAATIDRLVLFGGPASISPTVATNLSAMVDGF